MIFVLFSANDNQNISDFSVGFTYIFTIFNCFW
jgi:hypothetical protein